MNNLEKKFKSYIAMTSGMTIAMIVLGLIFMLMPGASLNIIRWIVTGCLIAAGLYSLMAFASFSGVVILVLGAVIALNPSIINAIPILLGIYILFSSVLKLISLSALKSTSYASYLATLIFSIVGIICGAVMIAHPDATNNVAMRIIGIMMLVYGISDFIDVLILRRSVEAFSRAFKKPNSGKDRKNRKGVNVADIPEAKIVKKK